MRAERVVLDTNVFVSALIHPASVPGRVLDHVVMHCRVVLTDNTKRELIAALFAPKFDKYAPRATRETVMLRLMPVMEVAQVFQIVRLCRDPHDDAVLEAALNGEAAVIVTGDKDLLELTPFRGIAILTPAQYLEHIKQAE